MTRSDTKTPIRRRTRPVARSTCSSPQPAGEVSTRKRASTPGCAGTYQQPGLFTTEARKRSREAAESTKVNAQRDRQKVLAFLRGRGEFGATDQEMQVELEMSGNTQRPRRGELVESGHVAEAGMKRKTISGCWATVWIATAKPRHQD